MANDGKKKLVKTVSTKTTDQKKTPKKGGGDSDGEGMLFERKHYIFIGFALGCMALGLIMMLGGRQTDPNVWDESVIYSFRRMVIAPAFILTGLIIGIVAIFKR